MIGVYIKRLFLVVLMVTLAGLVFSACQATAPEEEKIGTVNVLGVWGGDELASFQAMVEPWEMQTGGAMGFSSAWDGRIF